MRTPPSPLAAPLAWNLASTGYAEDNFDHFAAYSKDALDLAQVSASDRILDVAAGPGSLVIQAAARVAEVHAIDFSADMLAQLEARVAAARSSNVRAREGDGHALPHDEAYFAAAFSMFGLIFLPDHGKGFSALYREPERNAYGDVNWGGIIAFLVGLVPGWSVEDGLVPALQGPISTKLLGGADLSWFVGIVVAGSVYLLWSRRPWPLPSLVRWAAAASRRAR
jgi:SAM-dependent methyltransferase